MSDLEMEKEMQLLNQLLYGVESMSTSALVNEVIDLNRYKIIRKPWQVARAIRQKSNKAFVFIYNKN
ncbi:MAG: hypothetical protein ABIX01_09040 [Chitinophagaceae bacterium]